MRIIQAKYKDEDFQVRVDDEDFPVLSRHKWYMLNSGGKRYAYTFFYAGNEKYKMVPMTQVIMGNASYIDHIDLDPCNNQKANLRPATHQQNGWNKGKAKSCRHGKASSQYKGVSYRPLRGKDRWFASIKHVELGAHKSTGVMIRIGYYDTEDEAALAYNKKVVELRGERAWVNPVPNYDRSKGGE